MSVPVSQRKEHDFIASTTLTNIRKEITELALWKFGYDKDRHEKKIQKFEQSLINLDPEKKAQVVAKMRKKNESFYADFVEEETKATRNILRKAVAEFEMGNCIFPHGDALLAEYCEKRLHFDNAIGHMFVLIQELQYIAETLPCDKNRYVALTEEIKKEISLIKGVRQAANKYLKNK